VKVNGVSAVLGIRLKAGDTVDLDGQVVDWEKFAEKQHNSPYPAGLNAGNGFTYIKYFKGEGVNTTMSSRDPAGLIGTGHFRDVCGGDAASRLLPVGRLDQASTGVLLLTSDARLPAWLLGANTGCSKVYQVELDRAPTAEHVARWCSGVPIATPSSSGAALRTHPTLPCKVRVLPPSAAPPATAESGRGGSWVEFTLKEGRNRQIRRMVHALGYTVQRLHRASFCGVDARGLRRPGDWAPLTEDEMQLLRLRR
jgi:pseudouridine synthase